MPDRPALASDFLTKAGWSAARRSALAGDASNRKYERLLDPDTQNRAVLMDAAPEKGEDVRPFVAIATHLRRLGFSAPEILAEDPANGFLLLEDLGDDLFARWVAETPSAEEELYAAAVDFLIELHRRAPPAGLATYCPPLTTQLAALVLDWYLPAATGKPATTALREAFCAEIETLFAAHIAGPHVLVLRDFHAENLIWLPQRRGGARVGLLDFQDAMAGHPAYDLVSLLEDARRDVPSTLQKAMIQRYLRASHQPRDAFLTALAVLGAQRNLRILGVFTRLCVRDGKPQYTRLMPRMWHHLQCDLRHPALRNLRQIIASALPAPMPVVCEKIASQCPTNLKA